MTVTAPAPAPRSQEFDEIAELEALIEEARRRARRRRRRYAGVSALVLGLLAGALFAFSGHDDYLGRWGGDERFEPVRVTPIASAKNGELTILDYDTDRASVRAGGGRRDWYGLSSIGGDGRLKPLVRCPDGRDWCGWVVSADWAPDGRRLALSVTTLNTPNRNGIHVIDVPTRLDRHIGVAIAARDLDWAPDGRRLAFAERGVIKVLDVTTGNARAIAKGASPSWSPDGTWIAYATARVLTGRARVMIARPDGSDARLVVAGGAAPAWSPRGDLIAYRSSCGINLVTPDGRDMTPPSPFKCNAIGVRGTPVWSPDGRKIAIGASPTRPGLPHGTFVMDSDGSNLVRLTPRVHTTEGFAQPRPTWRPRR